MFNGLGESQKEVQRILEGRGPVETPAQKESDQRNSDGWDLHCEGRFLEAIRCFDEAIALSRRNALAMNNKGLSLLRLGRFEEALQAFDQAIAAAPGFVKPYSNKGVTYGEMGRRSEAAEWFRRALEVEPHYPRALAGLQKYCGRSPSEDEDQRASRLKRLLAGHPEIARCVAEGCHLYGVGRFEEALQRFEQAIQAFPDSAELLDMKAECLCAMGRAQESLQCATKATGLTPDFASAWVTRSWANLGMREYQEALSCAEQALALDPNHDMALNNAGAALMMLGRYTDAAERFSRALSANPNNVQAKMNRDACVRRAEPVDIVHLGVEDLALLKAFLEQGKSVAVAFDFGTPGADWGTLIELTEKYPRLVVTDVYRRPATETDAIASRLQRLGAARLALDMMIAAEEQRREENTPRKR